MHVHLIIVIDVNTAFTRKKQIIMTMVKKQLYRYIITLHIHICVVCNKTQLRLKIFMSMVEIGIP